MQRRRCTIRVPLMTSLTIAPLSKSIYTRIVRSCIARVWATFHQRDAVAPIRERVILVVVNSGCNEGRGSMACKAWCSLRHKIKEGRSLTRGDGGVAKRRLHARGARRRGPFVALGKIKVEKQGAPNRCALAFVKKALGKSKQARLLVASFPCTQTHLTPIWTRSSLQRIRGACCPTRPGCAWAPGGAPTRARARAPRAPRWTLARRPARRKSRR